MLSKVRSEKFPTWLTPLTDVGTQGTKVLESREIRTRMHTVREGAPATDVLARIVKYDGKQGEPRWTDIERGVAVNPLSWSGTHVPTDKFETLCHVAADISAAPYKRKVGKTGKVCYSRAYDVVLLVGLTELKAQIRWIDSRTVRIHE